MAPVLAPAAARQGVRSRQAPGTDEPYDHRGTHLRPMRVVPPQMAPPTAAPPQTPPSGKAQTTAAVATDVICHYHIRHQSWTGARRRTKRSQAPDPSRLPRGEKAICALGGERLEIGGHLALAAVEKCTTGGPSQAVGAGVAEAATELEREGPFRCMVRLPPATRPLRCDAERRDAAVAHTRDLREDHGRVRDQARTHTLVVPIRTATGPPTRSDHGGGVEVARHH